MKNTFGIDIIPENELQRLEVLKRYKILDTPPEDAFNNIARLATQIFNVPISLISLVDSEEVFFKANVGMGNTKSTSRGISLCSLALLDPEVTVFENAPKEPCLLTNPLVAGEFGLKFYAGAPLITHDGFLIGTMCIVDKITKEFTLKDREILKGLAAIVMDEIELRLSAIGVEQDKEMLRMATDAAKLGTWHLDIKANEFIPSPRLKQLFGYGHDEIMSYEAALNAIPQEYREDVKMAIELTTNNGSKYDIEHPVNDVKNNKLRWIKAIGKLYNSASGEPSHFSGALWDITERKLDDNRKNDFIAMVSHELKTPLTSLKGYIQMLQLKANEDVFIINALDKANNQVNKMHKMIQGFLDVSRFEAGKIHIDIQTFQIKELIDEAVDELGTIMHRPNIISHTCEDFLISGDKNKLGQVVNNLLSNAIKYSPKSTTIEITCKQVNDLVQVGIKDEGMGIKASDMEKLFDRFYRVESDNTRSIAGFGVGLYLCSEIIKRHHGKLWVESEYGKGSTFYFTLPLI